MTRTSAFVTLLVVGALLVGAVGPAAAQTAEESARSLAIDLHEDGSAAVSLTVAYELDSQDDRDAFTSLRDDRAAREQFRTRFASRMAAVAEDAENATGREMAVTDSDVSVETDGDTGLVTLSVTWDGLAAVEDDRLVVTEPFASGFATDRPVTLTVPDGYEVTAVSPEPTDSEDGAVTWSSGTALDGYEVTAAPAEGSDGGTISAGTVGTVADGPGFGAVAALLAIAVAVSLLARRR